MATYIDNIVKFHTFSKSPVSKDTTLGGAVNPSGHTVTTSQVRAQDIPAFLNTFQGTKEQAITWLGTNYPTPAHNDIVFYGGEFKAGFSTPKCLKWNAKLETPAWEDFDITTAATLKNADDKDVIAVHQNCTTVFVDGSNNAATNSNRNSLFVKKADGTILDHFVAATDKIVAGMPSLGYNALVLWNGGAIDEGELDANYIGNTFAGIVHLNKQYSTGDDAKFKVTCFEYIGEKLDTTLGDIDGKIQDIVGTTMEGVVASVGTTTAATTAGISVDSTTKTSPKIDISTGTVGGASDAKLVTGSTVKTYVDSATEKATVSAEGVVKEGDEAKLVTATSAQNIATKAASDEIAAAVGDGSIATKKSVDDLSDLVSALPATIEAAQDTANEAKATADTAIQTVKVNNTALSKSGTEVNITAIVGVDETPDTGIKVTKTSDNKVKVDVTPASYTSSNKTWTNNTYFAKASDIATAISDAVNGITIPVINFSGDATKVGFSLENNDRHYIHLATADYTPASASWTNQGYLVTGATVEAFVDAETTKTLDAAKAYSDSLHTTSLDYVVLGDNEPLPEPSADTLGKIYLVKEGNTANGETNIDAISGSYVEYMTRKVSDSQYTWEKIGTTAADLSGYAKSITINGKAYTASAANAGVLDLGTVVNGTYNSLPSNISASGVPNMESVYVGINEGSIGIGIASATDSVMGVSKLFTGDLSTTASTVPDTAVSVYSAQAMYGSLAALASGKVADVSPDSYLDLTGLVVSKNDKNIVTINASPITASNVHLGSNRTVRNGILDEYLAIDTTLIAFDGNSPADFASNARFTLTTWVGDMPNLVNGNHMFGICTALTSFCGDLSSLTNGYNMFYGCTALTSFCGDLSSLTNGYNMFYDCKLDAESLECIADTLPTVTSGDIDIGYNCSAALAQAAYDTITGKGWSCDMTYNA